MKAFKTTIQLVIITMALTLQCHAQYPAILGSTWYYMGFQEKTNNSFAVVPHGCAASTVHFYCDTIGAKLLMGVPDGSCTITNTMAANTRSNITCDAGPGDWSGMAILWQRSNNYYRVGMVHSSVDGGVILSNACGGYYTPNINLHSNDVIYFSSNFRVISKGETDASGNPIPTMWTGNPLYGGKGADPAGYVMFLPVNTAVTTCWVNVYGTR